MLKKRVTLLFLGLILTLSLLFVAPGVNATVYNLMTNDSITIGKLTDSTGASISFTKIDIILAGDGEINFLQSDYGWLKELYEPQSTAIPVKLSNNVISYITLDQISEYNDTGKAGALSLINGQKLPCRLLNECSFKVKSALGELTLKAGKVRTLQFNHDTIMKLLNGEAIRSYSYQTEEDLWPKSYSTNAALQLKSGQEVKLNNIGIVYVGTGYDDNWIPAQFYICLKLRKTFPVQYGDSLLMLKFEQLKSLTIVKDPKKGTITLNSTLWSGENLKLSVKQGDGVFPDNKEDSFSPPFAFIGTDDYGYSHVPLDLVQSITFFLK
ncbi:MAG TPA: hypothetical protein VHY08_27180 [Bacillota bacterium]|nr:hypothetical protein [Bacillota bacterium]